jgi:hypothetical protein
VISLGMPEKGKEFANYAPSRSIKGIKGSKKKPGTLRRENNFSGSIKIERSVDVSKPGTPEYTLENKDSQLTMRGVSVASDNT